ncbi:hypothetical protein Hypma_012235 [Hypsizygus marmoreus]|uniref:MYND-type domain-containing protein n=1 Tax=Hypsizygus marmoreus TaxID=39966 RepID=A0A369JEN8_HYPMA|nr:hypothetical protein Hypma_012235 [Hypsizygus marmoreus]
MIPLFNTENNPNNSSHPGVTSTLVAKKIGFDFTQSDMKADSNRWNNDWEKAHRLISATPPTEFFEILRSYLSIFHTYTENTAQAVQDLRQEVHKLQSTTADLYDDLDKHGPFRTAWILLVDSERRRHIHNGLQEACRASDWGQDARLLCPEITLNKIATDMGRAFITFLDSYRQGVKGADPDIYFLPNEWWGKVVDRSNEPTTELMSTIFTHLNLLRSQFIALFTFSTGMSVFQDLSFGSPGMDPVTQVIRSDPFFADSISQQLENARSKPILRCENCTKSPDMIEGNPRFMMCSVCKSKLDFVVHYCSQACQKEDWRRHKKHCGKAKVSKKLPGTINDPFWMEPDMSDSARNLPFTQTGQLAAWEMGFEFPHPLPAYSPALQRQISLWAGDKHVDYFLFDELDRPIPIYVHPTSLQLFFRLNRSVMVSLDPEAGVKLVGEYLLKKISNHPRLSRECILNQLGREFGEDMKGKIIAFEEYSGLLAGTSPGSAYLERMNGITQAMAPRMMESGSLKS